MFEKHTLRIYGWFFRGMRRLLRLFMRRYYLRTETLPTDQVPTVFISHHENLKGPARLILWLPFAIHTWVLSIFGDQEDCYHHYVNYTFTERFGMPRWLAKLIAYPFSYIVAWGTHSARTIPVYRGSRRIQRTFDMSIAYLQKNQPLVIYPDIDYTNEDTDIGKIYEGFLMLDRVYYRQTGERLRFVPIYASYESHHIRCGRPIYFEGKGPYREERHHVAQQVAQEMQRIIDIEASL